jgi:hypothetical protein
MAVRFLAVMALAGLPGLAVAGENGTPASVIARAVEAAGGLAELKRTAVSHAVYDGEMVLSAGVVPIRVEEWIDSPGGFRRSVQLVGPDGPGPSLLYVSCGGHGWVRCADKTEAADGNLLAAWEDARHCARIGRLYPLLADGPYTLAPGGRETANGRVCEVVAVSAPGFRGARLFFDARTGLLRRMTSDAIGPGGKTLPCETTYEGYRRVGNLRVPSVIRTTYDGRAGAVLRIRNVEFPAEIAPTLFAEP